MRLRRTLPRVRYPAPGVEDLALFLHAQLLALPPALRQRAVWVMDDTWMTHCTAMAKAMRSDPVVMVVEPVRYTATCASCPGYGPFDTTKERDNWAGRHTDATGHPVATGTTPTAPPVITTILGMPVITDPCGGWPHLEDGGGRRPGTRPARVMYAGG